jgi:hypothetical protein
MKVYNLTKNGVPQALEVNGAYTNQITVDESIEVTGFDSGLVVNANADDLVVQLPIITVDNLGTEIIVRNIGVAGDFKISVSPNEEDLIFGTVGAVTLTGVADKDIINTKATAKKGDYIKLQAVKIGEWAIAGGVGVWAVEA